MKSRSSTHVCPPVVDRATADKRKRTETAADEPVELLTIDDLAALLRRTPAAIRQAKYAGQLPPCAPILGRPMWRRSDVERWIAERFDAAARAAH